MTLQEKITRWSTVCLKALKTKTHFLWVGAQQRRLLSRESQQNQLSVIIIAQPSTSDHLPLIEWVYLDLRMSSKKRKMYQIMCNDFPPQKTSCSPGRKSTCECCFTCNNHEEDSMYNSYILREYEPFDSSEWIIYDCATECAEWYYTRGEALTVWCIRCKQEREQMLSSNYLQK